MKHLVIITGAQGSGKSRYTEEMYRDYVRWEDGTDGLFVLSTLINTIRRENFRIAIQSQEPFNPILVAGMVGVARSHNFIVDVIHVIGRKDDVTNLNIKRYAP